MFLFPDKKFQIKPFFFNNLIIQSHGSQIKKGDLDTRLNSHELEPFSNLSLNFNINIFRSSDNNLMYHENILK